MTGQVWHASCTACGWVTNSLSYTAAGAAARDHGRHCADARTTVRTGGAGETCAWVTLDARADARCGAPAAVLVWRSGLPHWNPYDPERAGRWEAMCHAHAATAAANGAACAAVPADATETILRPLAWGRPSQSHHGATH